MLFGDDPAAGAAAGENSALSRHGENKLADEYAQVWRILCDVLDQFVLILGELPLERGEFGRLLKLVLTQYDVGTIPAALDQVSVTEITRNDRQGYPYVFSGRQ